MTEAEIESNLTDIYEYIKELELMLSMVDLDTHWDEDDDERFNKAADYLDWISEMSDYIEECFDELKGVLTATK